MKTYNLSIQQVLNWPKESSILRFQATGTCLTDCELDNFSKCFTSDYHPYGITFIKHHVFVNLSLDFILRAKHWCSCEHVCQSKWASPQSAKFPAQVASQLEIDKTIISGTRVTSLRAYRTIHFLPSSELSRPLSSMAIPSSENFPRQTDLLTLLY